MTDIFIVLNYDTMIESKLFYITGLFKEALIKSNYFILVKTVRIFPEDRGNRITITAHFVKNTNTIPAPDFN